MLTNFMSMPGIGMPHEPGLNGPSGGEKVPDGEVSVMPQPSPRLQPVSSRKRRWTSTGSGAPPEPQNFSERRSTFSIPGVLLIAVYIVGTPQNTVTFFSARSFSTAAMSKRVCRMFNAPRRIPSSMLTDSA